MNMEALSYVKFGDKDGLGEFLFENGVQHQLFYEILAAQGILVQKYPLTDADTSNLDDWLFVHNDEHQRLASTARSIRLPLLAQAIRLSCRGDASISAKLKALSEGAAIATKRLWG